MVSTWFQWFHKCLDTTSISLYDQPGVRTYQTLARFLRMESSPYEAVVIRSSGDGDSYHLAFFVVSDGADEYGCKAQ